MNCVPTPDRDRTRDRPDRRPARARWSDPTLAATLGTVVGGAAANRPSLWFDEAATISAAANRSLSELCRLVTNIDAVHGLYYLLMHGWFAVFPATEFWSRLPSALAVGGGAAGVAVLSRQFCARRTALCAGALFAVLPRMTWAGIEARPYAFAAMAAVWLTELGVVAARRNSTRIWLGYGLSIVVAALLNTFSVLVVAAHAVLVRVVSDRRSAVIRWAVAAGSAVAALTPFLLLSQEQIWQVGWISTPGWRSITEVAEEQYFDKSAPFALLAGAVLVAATAARWAGVRRPPPGRPAQLAIICVAWMLIPTILTLAYSAVGTPVYYPRYLICTAPAMAVLLAIGVTTIAGKPAAVVALVVSFAVAAAPNYLVTQRDRHAKEGWDYSQVADLVGAHAAAGDCLLVDNTAGWRPGPIRALRAARSDAFVKLVDPGRGLRGPAVGRLWDGHVAVWTVANAFDRCTAIWAITNHDRTLPAHQAGAVPPPGPVFARTPAGQILRRLGFHPVERWQFSFSQVVKLTR